MARIECDGDHGKQGMNGCLDPRLIDGKWECVGKIAKGLIDEEQVFLNAYWDAGDLFNQRGEGR